MESIHNDLVSVIQSTEFKLGSTYELADLHSLTLSERSALPEHPEEAGCAGILRPILGDTASHGLVVKSVDIETYNFLRSLSMPGPLPEKVLGSSQDVAAMVLDGILEMKSGETFISGPIAAQKLTQPTLSDGVNGKIASLSKSAFVHALRMGILDCKYLSLEMYKYNTIPASPRWVSLMKDVPFFLGLSAKISKNLKSSWTHVNEENPDQGWLYWKSRHTYTIPRYKLYVSPQPQFIPEALSSLVSVLAEIGPVDFKIGKDIFGLLRPDKLVAYFEHFDHLQEVAQRLSNTLSTCPAQAVPFTAEIDPDGLLSWGSDPRVTENTHLWGGPQSWRLWLTQRIATAATTALAFEPGSDPWDFVKSRLSLDGVIPETWTPLESIWNQEI